MAAPLATCTLSSVFYSEGVKPIEIHRRMKVQYGDARLSLQQVYGWTRKFMNGISSVTDSPRPGQAHRVVTPEIMLTLFWDERGVILEHMHLYGMQCRLHRKMK